MDSANKTWVIPIVTAAIGAGGVVLAAYIAANLNITKPTEKQVIGSDLYKQIIDENAAKTVQIGELRNQIVMLQDEKSRFSHAVSEADRGAKQADSRSGENVPSIESAITSKELGAQIVPSTSTRASPDDSGKVTMSTPSVRRVELTLTAGATTRVRDDLTITLVDTQRFGAHMVINGQKIKYLTPGSRTPLPSDSLGKCVLEMISYDVNQPQPKTVRSDIVCQSNL